MGKEQELLDAARNGRVDVVDKILNLRFKKVNSLASLRKLPGPNTQDLSGYSCLHFAALNNHKDVVRTLLKHDANVNIVDKKGCSPLHLAAWAGHYDIVNYILMQSNIEPNVNLLNSDNESPLHSAAQFNHHSVVSLLLMHGADLDLRNSKDETSFDLACEYGRYETVKVMLDFKPELVYTSNHSHSPLHLAAKNGHHGVVKLLLQANFDVNCVTENGSALHEASFYGRIDIVSILLDYGIDTSLQNQQGKNVFDLLDQLNTSVSRTIESIIENHTALNSNHRIERRQSPLNKSTSLHILPPEQYKDKNQTSLHMNSELVAYAAAAEANQYSPNYSLDYVQPPKEFAQHSSSMNYYLDGGNAKFNSSHRPSRRKVSPMTSHCNEAKLRGNFSRSQDSMNSILDDYLQTVNAQQHPSLYDQPKQLHKKKSKPQLSAFAQPIYTSSTKYPVNHPSDDLYSSLDVDEPIYSYPATGCNDQQQPHSLQNDYLEQHYNEQIQPYSSFNYNDHNHHTSAHNLTNNQNLSSSSSISKQYNRQHQFNHQKIQSNHSSKSMNNRNSQSHHQLNYLNSQKIYASNINYQVERAPSHDSGYSMATYQTLDRDRDLSNQDRSFCSMNCDQLNSSYSLSNQEQQQQSQVLMRNGGELGMKRSMSNTSDSYLDNLSASCSSSKDLTSLPNSTANYSTLKRYSSVVDELKTNRLSRNVHPAMETVQRIKVNSNDLYAQIDKTRKNSLKATNTHTTSSISQNTSSSKIQDLLDFYDQPSKLIKKVTAGTNDQITTNKTSQTNGSKMINHMTAEQLELYTEIGKKVEKSQTSSSNKNKSTNHSFDQPANNNNNNSISSDQLRSQATFVKAKLNREKRATIAITLNENEIGELSFEARPPSPKMAANQISKILRPIHENYKKMKLKPNKHTMTDEKQFNRFQSGKKMVIIEKDLDRSNIVSVDKSTCTEEDREEERGTKTDTLKDKTQVKNADAENRKPTTNDLIDLDELKKLEDKFNEIKSTTKDNNNQITSSKVNSIQRPRRQAPAPPLPAHQGKETDTLKSTGSSATVNTETTNLNEKILEKVDKNLSSKERDLLTKSLNLPLNLDWKHDPLILYKQTCHYLAFYLGSNKLKNLQSALSSQQCIRNYRNLLNENNLSSLTAVIISISYKSIRCVDVNSQKILNEHEIRSVHFACQDMDHFRFFAYVTKDAEERGYFNCHVFSACSLEMTSEILITLAQAFEIAFRIFANGETIDGLRKHYVKSKLSNQTTAISTNSNKFNNSSKLPSPPLRHSSYSLDRNLNLSKSLSESQFNQLLISVSNGFRSSSRKSKEKTESKDEFKPKQVISASNSIKSIKSVKSESNFINRRKSLQSTTSNQLSSLNSLNHLNNLIKPARPSKPKSLLRHQISLPESKLSVLSNSSSQTKLQRANRPQIPQKPVIKR